MNTQTFDKIVEKSNTVVGNGIITLKGVVKFLKEDGWNVTTTKSTEYGSGVMHGRMMLRSPGQKTFTKVRAEKDGVVIVRNSADTSVSELCSNIVRAYK